MPNSIVTTERSEQLLLMTKCRVEATHTEGRAQTNCWVRINPAPLHSHPSKWGEAEVNGTQPNAVQSRKLWRAFLIAVGQRWKAGAGQKGCKDFLHPSFSCASAHAHRWFAAEATLREVESCVKHFVPRLTANVAVEGKMLLGQALWVLVAAPSRWPHWPGNTEQSGKGTELELARVGGSTQNQCEPQERLT